MCNMPLVLARDTAQIVQINSVVSAIAPTAEHN